MHKERAAERNKLYRARSFLRTIPEEIMEMGKLQEPRNTLRNLADAQRSSATPCRGKEQITEQRGMCPRWVTEPTQGQRTTDELQHKKSTVKQSCF